MQNNISWKNMTRLSSPPFTLASRARKAQDGDFPAGKLNFFFIQPHAAGLHQNVFLIFF
ncbi:hypothetical protein JOC37_001534 [Desulfohalotomaculum tongense]|nr:hypothetical protein [Desulforadius tongensis]